MSSVRGILLGLLLVAALPAQESRRSDADVLLDRVVATVGDAPKYCAAMFEGFQNLADETVYTAAAKLWVEGLELAPLSSMAPGRIQGIKDGSGVPAPKRAIAAHLRRAISARRGDREALLAERGSDGDLQNFLIIGPFGFAAESLAGIPFEPERAIDLDREVAGFDQRVSWARYAMSPAADGPNPFEVLTPESGATYALAQVNIPSDQTLAVMLEIEGSGDLIIDGKLALSIQKRREFVPSLRWVEAFFPAGWHQLLVKTTDSGVGSFSLSLVDKGRGPLSVCHEPTGPTASGVRVEIAKKLHPVTTPATGAGGKPWVARDVRDVAPFTGDRTRDLVAAFLWADSGLPEAAYAAIEPLLDAKDLDLKQLWIAARVVALAWHLPENDKKARVLDLARRAVAREPGFAPAVIELARNEASNDRAEQGIAMLQAALEIHPASVELWDAQIELLQSVGFESDRDRVLDLALKACPGSPRLTARKLAQLAQKRALPDWIALARESLNANATSLDLAQALAEKLLAARRFDDLRRLFSEQKDLHPHDLELAKLEADMHRELGDAASESRILETIAARHPKDTTALQTLATRALAAGDATKARAHLAQALDRDGDLHQVRRLLRELDPPAHDWFAEFLVDTDAFLAKAPGKDAYPDSRIVLLLDQIVLWVHPDGSAEQEIHQLHRLQDARGKEDLGTVYADGDVKAVQTIMPDGKRLVPNQVSRGAFEMAGLTPGAIVERRHRRYIDRSKGRPEGFGGFFFQDTRLVQPFHYTRYVVIVPKNLGLEPVVERFGAEPKKTERGNDVVWEFLLERMPRIQKEVYMPRAEDLVPRVEFRRPDNWAAINRRYLDVYESSERPTPPIEAAAKTAIGTESDPLQRARILYEFVMDTVTSNEGVGGPTQTLLDKSGDRFPLYLALLRAGGVPYTLAMGRVQEKLSPPVKWEMVSEALFDTPLARIEPPGAKPVYVSTQFRFMPFGQIRFELTDAPVFVTSADGGRIERTPAASIDDVRAAQIEMEVGLDAAGVAKGTVRVQLLGLAGAWIKEQIERMDKKRLEQFTAQVILGPIGRLAPSPKAPARFLNTTSRKDPLVIEMDVELKQLVKKTESGATLGLPFPLVTFTREFVDRKERKLPFVFHQYRVQSEEARITLDPAWKLDDAPKDYAREGPLGSYRLRRSADGSKLILRRELKLVPADVPAADFAGVATFAKDVDEAEAQKITLRRETQ